ncbi:MAG: hypothetical protein HY613_06565 [Candidatus Rokubacteria bacterium]|nr:hypothetical protein [Candidatus Rokubacteria bacterium]
MTTFRHRFQMYRHLEKNRNQILAEAEAAALEIGIPSELKGNIGLTGAVSGCHGLLMGEVARALDASSRKVIANKVLDEELREVVKDYYGDEYDAATVSTCEAALWVSFDVLATPPFTGRGESYRSRYIAPYERHMHHQASYGRPFPGKYKDLYADRGCTAGELGFYGKRQYNLDTVIVPLEGAKYECHGLKYHPAPLLVGVDPGKSLKRLEEAARIHGDSLGAFASLGYDSPGYGYGVKDKDGVAVLQKGLGELAARFNVPYIVDNAWGVPFIGTDPRRINCDVMLYSVDKATLGPTAGLIIGKEEAMVQIRRALGIHGERFGTGASHGKAAYVTIDAGKEGLVGTIAALKILRDRPDVIVKPMEHIYDMVLEEFEKVDSRIKDGLLISKALNSGAVEINYEKTWRHNGLGLPIFPIEDFYAGSELLMNCIIKMGIVPTISYDGNVFISPGLGTMDENGNLLEKPMRYAIKAVARSMEIIGRASGFID